MNPSNDNLIVSRKSGQSMSRKSGHPEKEHHARIPNSVLHDSRLTFGARCVYAAIAGWIPRHQGTISTCGVRRLARELGCGRSTVELAIKSLIEFNHIERVKIGSCRRTSYHLTSNLFTDAMASEHHDKFSNAAVVKRFTERRNKSA